MKRGISIHIGLNYVDMEHYGSDVTPLDTCEQDAKDMHSIALSQDFKSSYMLLSENATREAVKSAIASASTELFSGDILFLTYSGHGGFVPDDSGDEKDNLDETWCLYDGQLLDDELYHLWSVFDEGVRIFILSDSCHSGTVAKANPNGLKSNDKIFKKKLLSEDVAEEVYFKNKDFYSDLEKFYGIKEERSDNIKASIKLFAACQDPQVSYTMTFAKNSIFTEKLKEVWDNGRFSGNYSEFFDKISEEVEYLDFLPTPQTPNLFSVGAENIDFDEESPFKI
jgi:hypothetical protein